MPEVFHVRLSSIEEFNETVGKALTDYQSLTQQLASTDLNKVDPGFHTLLGGSYYEGSSAVRTANFAMLCSYAELYGKIRWAHETITKQLAFVQQALTDTHQLYSQTDAKHAAVFEGFLGASHDVKTGGEHGTAGQE